MARSIKLTITPPTIQTIDGDTGYYLKFTLSEAVEMPNELFVHRINLPMLGDDMNEFSHIASPNDIEEYPVGLANVVNSDFYRTDECELLFQTIDRVASTRLDMQSKIADVIAKLNLLDATILVDSVSINF